MPHVADTVWIDVGGTKTAAWRFEEGAMKRVFHAPSDPKRLPSVVRWTRPKGGRVVIGLRGAWTPSEKASWRKTLRLRPGDRVLSDIELAHEFAFGGDDGIVLNGGTGSIAFGKRGKKTARAGGLGVLIGDDGSAFWIGREYIRRVALKKEGFDRIRSVVTSPDAVRAIAQYTKKALADMSPIATTILTEAADALVALSRDVRRQLGGTGLPLAVHGGLFDYPRFKKIFERKLAQPK